MKKSKNSMPMVADSSYMKPHMSISSRHAPGIKQANIGDNVHVMVAGKVTSKRQEYDNPQNHSAEIDINKTQMKPKGWKNYVKK